MIYFKNDYSKYDATPHYTTSNSSFIKVAMLYKKMGIENYAFMLALHDQELIGVDPHDPNITEEQYGRVLTECKRNPWYFFREVARAPNQGGSPIPFQAHRGNIAQIWLAMNDISQLDILPRQTGKTVGALWQVNLYVYLFTGEFDVGIMAKDALLVRQNIARLKVYRDTLPFYFVKKGSTFNNNNAESLQYCPEPGRKVTVHSWTANSERIRADGHGRGGSYVCIFVDEAAHCVNMKYSMNSMVPACSTSFQNARRNGLPCSIILATTPGYTKTEHGEYLFHFRSKCVRFTEKFFDIEKKKDILDQLKVHGNGYVLVEFLGEMLGKDAEWFEFMKTQMEPEEYARDVELKWIHGSETGAIDQAILDKIRAAIQDPMHLEQREGLTLRWFIPKAEICKYRYKPILMGVDNSDNRGRDGTTFVLTDPSDLSVIMTMHCNQENTMLVIRALVSLMVEFTMLVLVPEQNRFAFLLDGLIMELEKLNIDPFKRIFNQFVDQKNSVRGHDLALGSVRKQFGFVTSRESRNSVLFKDVLKIVVNKAYDRLRDHDLWGELANLIKIDGRIDHPPGGHDDLVIAYLLTVWFVMYANNIGHYGLNAYDMASNLVTKNIDNRLLLQQLHTEHHRLSTELKRDTLPMPLRRKYLFMLQGLEKELELNGSVPQDVISIHQSMTGKRESAPTDKMGFLQRSRGWSPPM